MPTLPDPHRYRDQVAKALDAVDRGQRRFPPVGFPLAVIYKFFDDQGNYLAAIITYYAFVAIFPLLLLGSSILGFFLQGNPDLQSDLIDSALAQFPIIGDQLGQPEGLRDRRAASSSVASSRCTARSGSARRSRTPSTSPGRSRATAGPTRCCSGSRAWACC